MGQQAHLCEPQAGWHFPVPASASAPLELPEPLDEPPEEPVDPPDDPADPLEDPAGAPLEEPLEPFEPPDPLDEPGEPDDPLDPPGLPDEEPPEDPMPEDPGPPLLPDDIGLASMPPPKPGGDDPLHAGTTNAATKPDANDRRCMAA